VLEQFLHLLLVIFCGLWSCSVKFYDDTITGRLGIVLMVMLTLTTSNMDRPSVIEEVASHTLFDSYRERMIIALTMLAIENCAIYVYCLGPFGSDPDSSSWICQRVPGYNMSGGDAIYLYLHCVFLILITIDIVDKAQLYRTSQMVIFNNTINRTREEEKNEDLVAKDQKSARLHAIETAFPRDMFKILCQDQYDLDILEQNSVLDGNYWRVVEEVAFHVGKLYPGDKVLKSSITKPVNKFRRWPTLERMKSAYYWARGKFSGRKATNYFPIELRVLQRDDHGSKRFMIKKDYSAPYEPFTTEKGIQCMSIFHLSWLPGINRFWKYRAVRAANKHVPRGNQEQNILQHGWSRVSQVLRTTTGGKKPLLQHMDEKEENMDNVQHSPRRKNFNQKVTRFNLDVEEESKEKKGLSPETEISRDVLASNVNGIEPPMVRDKLIRWKKYWNLINPKEAPCMLCEIKKSADGTTAELHFLSYTHPPGKGEYDVKIHTPDRTPEELSIPNLDSYLHDPNGAATFVVDLFRVFGSALDNNEPDSLPSTPSTGIGLEDVEISQRDKVLEVVICYTTRTQRALHFFDGNEERIDGWLTEVNNELKKRYDHAKLTLVCCTQDEEAKYEFIATKFLVERGDLVVDSQIPSNSAGQKFLSFELQMALVDSDVDGDASSVTIEEFLDTFLCQTVSIDELCTMFGSCPRKPHITGMSRHIDDVIRCVETNNRLMRGVLKRCMLCGVFNVKAETSMLILLDKRDNNNCMPPFVIQSGYSHPAQHFTWPKDSGVTAAKRNSWREMVKRNLSDLIERMQSLEPRDKPRNLRGFFVCSGGFYDAAVSARIAERILPCNHFLEKLDERLREISEDVVDKHEEIATLILVYEMVHWALNKNAYLVAKQEWEVEKDKRVKATWCQGFWIDRIRANKGY